MFFAFISITHALIAAVKELEKAIAFQYKGDRFYTQMRSGFAVPLRDRQGRTFGERETACEARFSTQCPSSQPIFLTSKKMGEP